MTDNRTVPNTATTDPVRTQQRIDDAIQTLNGVMVELERLDRPLAAVHIDMAIVRLGGIPAPLALERTSAR